MCEYSSDHITLYLQQVVFSDHCFSYGDNKRHINVMLYKTKDRIRLQMSFTHNVISSVNFVFISFGLAGSGELFYL